MRKILFHLTLLILPLFLMPVIGQSQTKAMVQNIDFNVVGDSLVITYDILKAKSSERFKAYLEVKTVTGKTFEIKSVSGDVDNISGGKGKRIVWNVISDRAVIDADIYVNVILSPILADAAAAGAAAAVTPAVVAQPPAETVVKQEPKGEKVYSKGMALLLSAVVPGLGITKLRAGGPYWLIGLADYGLLIGGIVLNSMSSSTYNKYKDATTASDRNTFYDKAVSQNKTGNTLLYAAGGLWVVNMIITAVVPAKLRYAYSIGPTYDPVINQPMLTFRYRIGK